MAKKKMVHLVINAFPLQDQHQRRGIGRYTQEVVNRLVKLVTDKDKRVKNFKITLVLSQAEVPLSFKEKQYDQLQIWTIPKSIPHRTSTQLLHAFVYVRNSLKRLHEKITKEGETSVFFLPHHRMWLPTFFDKKVIMVHDLYNIMFKEYTPNPLIFPVKKAEHAYYLNQLEKADLIITNSHETATRVQQLSATRRTIQPIPLGLPEIFMKSHRLKKSVRPIKEPYFIYYGGYDKNKNIPQIIKTLEKFNKNYSQNVKIVMVGGENSKDKIPKSSATYLAPTVDDETLIQYIKNSLGLFRLSEYEGFGLPELEVMALGRPVISSSAGAVPEIVVQHGFLFDPQKPRGIQKALKTLADEKVPESRLKKAQKYARSFTWEQNVTELIKAIEDIT